MQATILDRSSTASGMLMVTPVRCPVWPFSRATWEADTGVLRAASPKPSRVWRSVIPLYLIDDYAPFPFNAMSATYGPWVNHAPWLWRLAYRFGASRERVEWAELATYPLVRRQISPPLVTTWPDLVISVHPLQINLPLRILRSAGNRAPFISVVTDPVTPPVAWFCSDVDLCVVATEPARRAALANGMDPSKVKVIGLPIRRAFAEIHGRSRPDARAALGLRADLPLVLLTGGGAGIGKLLPTARAITANWPARGRRPRWPSSPATTMHCSAGCAPSHGRYP